MQNVVCRTSVSVDEAVAFLLGWNTGPLRDPSAYFESSPEYPEEEFDTTYSLNDERESRICEAVNALDDAKDEHRPALEIEALRIKLREVREADKLAATYLCDVNDEMNKGNDSALRPDTELLKRGYSPYITLTSLNEWAQGRYGKNILKKAEKPEPTVDENVFAVTEPVAVPIAHKPAVRRKMRDQEEVIMAEIKRLGYDAKSLPQASPGKAGVKQTVRTAVGHESCFQNKDSPNGGAGVFDKAWERLRKDGSIKDKEKGASDPSPYKKTS